MKRLLTLPRLTALFAVLLALSIGAVLIFQAFWLDPGARCEAKGNWYDLESRTCAQPIYIPNITGRLPGESRAEASDRKNRELLEAEAEAARQQRALEAEIARQQAAQNAAPAK